MDWIDKIRDRFAEEKFPTPYVVAIPVDFRTPAWERPVYRMMRWCKEQCRSRHIRRLRVEDNIASFEFEHHLDAVTFKLTFG